MKKSYSKIWNYLEGKLSTKEEDELINWIGQSERNAVFFDQVVQDFNRITQLSPTQKSSAKWYWAAACLIGLVSVSLVLVNLFQGENTIRNFTLADGSEITLGSNTAFEYDSLSYNETKWIKIQGTAEITTKTGEHLLVETQNGYLILESESSLQIRTLKNKDINLLVLRGSIKWLNPIARGEEFTMASGENALLKNDGKTILLQTSKQRQNTFMIFDNYMNL